MTDIIAQEAEETNPLDMQTLLLEIARALVDEPSKVFITEQSSENTVLLTVHCDPADFGKLCGKQGTTIHLLRDLFSKIGAVDALKVSVELNDPKAAERPRRTRNSV